MVQARAVAGQVTLGEPKTRSGAREAADGRWRHGGGAVRLATPPSSAERLAAGPKRGRSRAGVRGRAGCATASRKTITRRWGEACRGAGVRPIRLHDTGTLRRRWATSGVPVRWSPAPRSLRPGTDDAGVSTRQRRDDRAAAEALRRALGGQLSVLPPPFEAIEKSMSNRFSKASSRHGADSRSWFRYVAAAPPRQTSVRFRTTGSVPPLTQRR